VRKPFQFKQFAVSDRSSAMKINTDAVLLGAWCDVETAVRALDIGTGCGIIALMMAQRTNARIDAIDIDKKSIEEAAENFSASPWSERIKAIHMSLQQFSVSTQNKYDIIVCNPPFFHDSLTSPKQDRTFSKHDIMLAKWELISGVSGLLAVKGILSLILPPFEMRKFEGLAGILGLYRKRQLLVRHREDKPVHRILTEFTRNEKKNPELKEITLRNADNAFSSCHNKLTEVFYISC
jgi:tRNA1Val (adenine37-N6)-methyltransferase